MQTRKLTRKQPRNPAHTAKQPAATPGGTPTKNNDIKGVTVNSGTAAIKRTGVIQKEGDTPIITGTGK